MCHRALGVWCFTVMALSCAGPHSTFDAGTPGIDDTDAGNSVDAGAGQTTIDAGAPDAGFDDAGADGVPHVGVLLGGTGAAPGPLVGIAYEASGLRGVTDATGTFHYREGRQVVFSVGDVVLGEALGAATVSPFDLAGHGCTHSNELARILSLVYSLDADGDFETGVALSVAPVTAPTRRLNALTEPDVDAFIAQQLPGRARVSDEAATDVFVRYIDDETWSETGKDTFNLATALTRGQGVASDGVSWWFSGTVSLERTDGSFSRQKSNALAIPSALSSAGSNHIGDIDVVGNTLYAPIEDGPQYQHPAIVLYDAQTLSAGTVWPIPQALQTKGVPWVAVNAAQQQFYLAEWDPTTQLNVFSLSDGGLVRSLPLRAPAQQTVKRIQGAKLFEHSLYAASDDATKSVWKINLETGTVFRLFGVNTSTEQEGIAFHQGQMHTLDVVQLGSTPVGSELRHYTRTRQPLRLRLCP